MTQWRKQWSAAQAGSMTAWSRDVFEQLLSQRICMCKLQCEIPKHCRLCPALVQSCFSILLSSRFPHCGFGRACSAATSYLSSTSSSSGAFMILRFYAFVFTAPSVRVKRKWNSCFGFCDFFVFKLKLPKRTLTLAGPQAQPYPTVSNGLKRSIRRVPVRAPSLSCKQITQENHACRFDKVSKKNKQTNKHIFRPSLHAQ